MKTVMNIILYGPEGSGKSTQGKLLAEKLKVITLVSGDLVRNTCAEDKGYLGEVCRAALHAGKYVGDSEMFVLWKKRLKVKDILNGWVMDGFPRNVHQAKFLAHKLSKHKQQVDHVFYLNVPIEISVDRLSKRGRRLGNGELHDSPERIAQRLKIYHEQEEDVLNYYKEKGLLREIDGTLSIEEVHEEIVKQLEN